MYLCMYVCMKHTHMHMQISAHIRCWFKRVSRSSHHDFDHVCDARFRCWRYVSMHVCIYEAHTYAYADNKLTSGAGLSACLGVVIMTSITFVTRSLSSLLYKTSSSTVIATWKKCVCVCMHVFTFMYTQTLTQTHIHTCVMLTPIHHFLLAIYSLVHLAILYFSGTEFHKFFKLCIKIYQSCRERSTAWQKHGWSHFLGSDSSQTHLISVSACVYGSVWVPCCFK